MRKMNRLYWLKQEISQIEEQLNELSTLPDSIENLLMLRSKLDKKLIEYVEERLAIEGIINDIDEPEIRVIARKRYIENKSWGTIGDEMFMDRTTAYKKLKRYENHQKGGGV